jgi:hypothetical protein
VPTYSCTLTTSWSSSVAAASAPATRAVSSRAVPSGRSTMTWNSLLLSKGSILTLTSPSGTRVAAAASISVTLARNTARSRPLARSGCIMRR